MFHEADLNSSKDKVSRCLNSVVISGAYFCSYFDLSDKTNMLLLHNYYNIYMLQLLLLKRPLLLYA